jgi:hypothetical protein
LFAHASGQWAKKIRQRVYYFGVCADPAAALANYERQKDALQAGRKPAEATGALTMKGAASKFLAAKQAKVDNGELIEATWANYKRDVDIMIATFGESRLVSSLDPSDFAVLRKKLAERYGPVLG